ncbi:hypothetical protein C8035_v004139 [Colletotrichum spinosum]|uniref:Uncharacterized protein n=1 Tax=Colletotrichum spinosum TaxID=1347390 RepID=A0A4R8QVN3_9PEZI|nr:hypothetical protein C8035_v004139 [Colletotrichum spinosum]
MVNQKHAANKSFAFVIADLDGKPKSADRKLIRSHVMRGKNTRDSRVKASRSTTRTRMDKDEPQATQSRGTAVVMRNSTSRSTCSPDSSSPGSSSDDDKDNRKEDLLLEVLRTPGDMHMFKFADEIDAKSRAMLFEFYANIKEAMYPVEWCVRFDVSKTPWFYWLLSDPAYLHSVLFTVAMLHDSVRGHKLSKKTSYHIGKTLSLLNKNIARTETALSDSTLATIVSMCMVAEAYGDHEAAAAHIAGLRRIVELRGGLGALRHNLQLHVKICRSDLGWSLLTGEKPVYYRDSISWEPAFDSILGPLPGELRWHPDTRAIRTLMASIDLRLNYVFQDLHDFSRLAGFVAVRGKMDPNLFQELMTSVQYRILYIDPIDNSPLTEAFRLGMLGYITTLFLQLCGIRFRFSLLAKKTRAACKKVTVSDLSTPAAKLVHVWTLFMSSTSILEADDDVWILPKLAGLRGTLGETWPEAKEKLSCVLWIPSIHDTPGIKLFKRFVLHVAQVPSPSSHHGVYDPAERAVVELPGVDTLPPQQPDWGHTESGKAFSSLVKAGLT